MKKGSLFNFTFPFSSYKVAFPKAWGKVALMKITNRIKK